MINDRIDNFLRPGSVVERRKQRQDDVVFSEQSGSGTSDAPSGSDAWESGTAETERRVSPKVFHEARIERKEREDRPLTSHGQACHASEFELRVTCFRAGKMEND